ncbi:hypothetical protein TRIP_C20029 [Candidatus Zixiibacteriota bacterium]|nr:hypothetical protein TRIP_C20029 [candidate division Zixibacteria bacterium]
MALPEERNLKFIYDKERDVFYASIDRPQAAICEDTEEGVLIRRDPRTRAIVGFTIYNYSQKRRSGVLKSIPNFRDVILPSF